MACGVRYVPLVPPGENTRSKPENVSTYDRLSKYKMLSKLNNAQAAEAKIKLQAIMKEIEAERERDMAITSPTRPLFYMPPTIRPGQLTSPVDQVLHQPQYDEQYFQQQQPYYFDNNFEPSSFASTSSFDALHYLPPLDTSLDWQSTPGLEFLEKDFSFDLPPLTDDMDCSSSGSVEDEDFDQQLQDMISSLPDGRIPEDSEHWTSSYPELNELIASSTQDLDMEDFSPTFELPDYITDAGFSKSIHTEMEAVLSSLPVPDLSDAPTPVPAFLQDAALTDEPEAMETTATVSA